MHRRIVTPADLEAVEDTPQWDRFMARHADTGVKCYASRLCAETSIAIYLALREARGRGYDWLVWIDEPHLDRWGPEFWENVTPELATMTWLPDASILAFRFGSAAEVVVEKLADWYMTGHAFRQPDWSLPAIFQQIAKTIPWRGEVTWEIDATEAGV